MENQFVIEARYETFTPTGKKFIDWFVFDITPRSEKETKDEIKSIKKSFSYIDSKTKLKHEYRLKSYTEYENEYKQLKENVKKLEKRQKEYYKSAEYKELQKKKRITNKELKERQKKYLEEHTKPTN